MTECHRSCFAMRRSALRNLRFTKQPERPSSCDHNLTHSQLAQVSSGWACRGNPALYNRSPNTQPMPHSIPLWFSFNALLRTQRICAPPAAAQPGRETSRRCRGNRWQRSPERFRGNHSTPTAENVGQVESQEIRMGPQNIKAACFCCCICFFLPFGSLPAASILLCFVA